MATVFVALGRASGRSTTGATMPVFDAQPIDSEELTPTSSSALGTLVAPDEPGVFWAVAADAAVFVAFGEEPDAGAAPRWYLAAGQQLEFAAQPGETIAVKLV